MNQIKMAFAAFLMINALHMNAQNQSLAGQWESRYELEGEKFEIAFEFKDDKGALQCHTLFLRDDQGNTENYDSIAMTDIQWKDKKGKAQYFFEYEGETYEVEASLHLVDANTLEVQYSYYGYSETEIWKKVK